MAVFQLGSWVFGWGDDYRAKLSGRDGLSGSRGYTPREVGPDAAMRLGTVWACIRLLSETIGTLPMGFYKRDAKGGREAASSHPLYSLLHDSPNADQTAAEFWESVVAYLCTSGNFYAEKVVERGRLVALLPFRTGSIAVTRDRNGARVYRHVDGSKTRELSEDQVFHVRGFGFGGDVGLSPISYARDSLGLAIDTEWAARSSSQNGIRGAGFLIVPGKPTPEQKKGIRETFIDPMVGPEATARAGILEQGMDWKEVKGMSSEDLQLLQGRAFNVEELCRWFRVPPFMIGHTEKSTSWGTGLEQQMIGFLTFSLRPYLTRIEQAVKKQLILPADRSTYYAEFNLEGLLRADSQGRAALYNAFAQNGINTRNEIRGRENMPPLPGGDMLTVQSNLLPLEQLGKAPPRAVQPAAGEPV